VDGRSRVGFIRSEGLERLMSNERGRSASVEATDLDEVNSQLTRLGRRADAKKRRGTYVVEDVEDWTMRAETFEVRLTMSGNLWDAKD
jgi:hypothetical protein